MVCWPFSLCLTGRSPPLVPCGPERASNTGFCNIGDVSCELYRQADSWDEASALSGAHTGSVTLGPGDYMFFMSAGAAYEYGRTADDLGFNSTIGVSTVPVPAAVWLFGSALALLGWSRKRG